MSKWADLPVPGDEIYVGTSLYMSRGRDDVWGGKAIVERVEDKAKFGWPEHNRWWVYVKGIERGYNWTCLLRDQRKLQAEYRDRQAKPCPDPDPSANTG